MQCVHGAAIVALSRSRLCAALTRRGAPGLGPAHRRCVTKGVPMDTQELTQEQVTEFVLNAHGNPDKVKALLAEHPGLINTRWAQFDESALDAAGHTGRRAIAEYLLAAGATPTIFAAAMLGQTAQVR